MSIQAHIEGSIPPITLLIATAGNGLLLLNNGILTKIIDGDILYGVTRCNYNWWVFRQKGNVGEILSFNIDAQKGYNIKRRIGNLNLAVHQIDFIGNSLAVVDTQGNRVHIFDNAQHKSYLEESTTMIVPRGPTASRKDKNYCHLNSVFADREKIYILAHNNISGTRRSSEVFVYDRNYNKVSVLPLFRYGAHNYCRVDGAEFFCDSERGTLRRDGRIVFGCDSGSYTRGLSISDDIIALGSSGISPVREDRRNRDGNVYIMDREFRRMAKITLPKTQIMEIRRVDKKEYTLSNTEQV